MKLLFTLRCSSILFFSVLLLQGCSLVKGGKHDSGELVGAPKRKGWKMTTPYGMVLVPGGSFIKGQVAEEVAYSKISPNQQVTVRAFYMDDTEITNNEYRQFTDSMQDSVSTLGEDFINSLYPDTTVWMRDVIHTMADDMRYYFENPSFDDYPVVGVTWEAAKYFAEWRTNLLNAWREKKKLWPVLDFRLPTEAEWEYAAKGGKALAKYPWGGPYARDKEGNVLANFKSKRGNYAECGFEFTSPVRRFPPNDYGLCGMAGNVAEWCIDAYNPDAEALVWNINPVYIDDDNPLKVIKGGSWKDISKYLQTGVKSYEHKDSARSYIGFRCVMSPLGDVNSNFSK